MARISTNKTGMSMSQDQLKQAIQKKAYELFEKRGHRAGHAMEDWLEAERLVRQKSSW